MLPFTDHGPWDHRVDVSDIFRSDLPFEDQRDRIVERLRDSDAIHDGTKGKELEGLIDELAETTGYDWFNEVWIHIYDLADHQKWLWINTI